MIETVILWAMGVTGGTGMGICLALDALRDDIPAITAWIQARRGHSAR